MGVRVAYLVTGLAVAACLGALIGCGGGGTFNSGKRAPWRASAEQACLTSGAVRASPFVQSMAPIKGPGVCGLDVPWRHDGIREFEDQRRAMHERYVEHARASGSPWVLVEGPLDGRLEAVAEALDPLLD